MNVHPSSSPAYLPPPHTIHGINPAGQNKPIETETDTDTSTSDQAKPTNPLQRSPEEEKIIKELRATDQEVRAHEMAHLAAAGGHGSSTTRFTLKLTLDSP